MDHEDYRIAIISALAIEHSCAEALLDQTHPKLRNLPNDANQYTFGRIGHHNVVLACLPNAGAVSAATVAGRVRLSFPKLRFGLLVGIGGAAPDMENRKKNDIRLGDVVVSWPNETFGGVVQYDMGKTIPAATGSHATESMDRDSQSSTFMRPRSLNSPPSELLSAITALQAKHLRSSSDMSRYLHELGDKHPKLLSRCSYQGSQQDQLFEALYNHQGIQSDCTSCNLSNVISRPERQTDEPVIHYGIIASANQVMRHGATRDRVAAELGVLCFEMEAAGLMNDFPCLVIRGICDYADSHKNKQWQPYAAAVAAAFAKELLWTIPAEHSKSSATIRLSNFLRSRYFYAVVIALLGIAIAISSLIGSDVFSSLSRVTDTSNQLMHFHVPNRLTPHFVGRSDVLSRIDHALRLSDKARPIVVLRGLGGQGKSQVALRYCYLSSQAHFKSIFWLDASSEALLRISIENTAVLLGAPLESLSTQDLKVSYVLGEISSFKSPWLMVFDNYDDPYTFSNIRDYFPHGNNGAILVTSRHVQSQMLVNDANSEDIILEGLDDESAIDFLLEQSSQNSNDSARKEAQKVVNRLGNHPLAIAQAGAFVKIRKFSLDRFLYYYNRDRRKILESMQQLSQYGRKLGDDEKETALNVFTTWEISMQQLEMHHGNTNFAVVLLGLLAMLHHTGVSVELLKSYVLKCFPGISPENFEHLQPFLHDRLCDGDLLAEAINLVEELSLVKVTRSREHEPSHLQLHPLIQDWVRLRTDNGTFLELFAISVSFIGHSMMSSPTGVAGHTRADAIEHIIEQEHIWNHLSMESAAMQSKTLARPIFDFHYVSGRVARQLGFYDLAKSILSRTLSYRRTYLGETHKKTLDCMAALAKVYRFLGHLPEAENLQEHALSVLNRTLGNEHEATLQSMNSLASIYGTSGRWKEAEELRLQALEIEKRVLGEEYDETLATMSNLASLYGRQGRLEDAETMEVQLLKAKRRTLGNDHLETRIISTKLAITYVGQGRYEEAANLLEKVVDMAHDKFREHPNTLEFKDMLVTVYIGGGRLAEAETLLVEVIDGMKHTFGKDHHRTLMAMSNLAKTYVLQDRLSDAERVLVEKVGVLDRSLGRVNPITVRAVGELVDVYKSQGRWEEAQELEAQIQMSSEV